MNEDQSQSAFHLSLPDIERAVRHEIISKEDADRLVKWAYDQRFEPLPADFEADRPTEQPKGFNLVTVAYYFGAMLMISACAWFLGDKWESLGSGGVLGTVIIYATIATSLGLWLRMKGYSVGGGLMVTVAVCLVPLVVYCIEDLLGLWPAGDPGRYENYYPWINGSWIVMELATILVAAVALRHVRFGFLTAPLAFSFWFFSMDLAALILGEASLQIDVRKWISIIVGLITMFIGYGLDRELSKPGRSSSEDYAFWCYLFGLMAFWGGLTSMDSGSELGRLGYAFVNVCLVGISIKLRRTVFLVFGAVGIFIYIGHLAYEVFADSIFFPFAIALLGLGLILVTVYVQRRLLDRVDA